MSVTKYQVFLTVAACGGFTRAAEELHFTQSGVSHTVAALESELGVPLFVRNRSGVNPHRRWPGSAALYPGPVGRRPPPGAKGRRPPGSGHGPGAGGHL